MADPLSKGGSAKRRGTKSEYLVRDRFKEAGWAVVRSGGSLGPVDLVCMRRGEVVLVQVKRKADGPLYLAEKVPCRVQGFPVTLVADFGRGNLRVVPKRHRINPRDGISLGKFLANHSGRGLAKRHCLATQV